MPDFNAAQRAAIDAQNQNILISAAAGSGKTTVMVQKIIETLIRDPESSISQFLVITFTRDAAQNMKDKLRTLLENVSREGTEAASRALGEIETASISTIHSFCTQLLKEYSDNTGITVNPRILKETEKKRMLDECFTDAVETVMGAGSPYTKADRLAADAILSAFGAEELAEMVRSLYDVLTGIPDPFDFLSRIVSEPPTELWNREILNAVELDLTKIGEVLRQESDLMNDPLALDVYEPILESDRQITESLSEAYSHTDSAEKKRALLISAADALSSAPILRKLDGPTHDWKKQMDGTRGELKGATGLLRAAASRIESVLDEKNIRLNAIIQQELRGLEVLLRETAAQYERQKLEAGAIDYADMEQTAYRIISDPDKRTELLAKYKYIYVDECQDVSGIQDAIIKSLTGPGHQFFMVGDIKQSIYGFRHAEPDLFEQERRSYSDSEDATERRIFFMDNYRSRASVVEAVNAVFTEAMDRRVTDMDYIPEDNLRCNLPGDSGPVDIILVRKGEEEADRLEAQCEAVGRYIRSILATASEAGGEQRWHYRDIVILVRAAKGTASVIVDHLKKMHIPAMYEGVPDFFGLAEVKAFLSLLTVIDNPRNDDALAGTLLNAPFLFTESELAAVRLEKHEHVPFYEAFELCAGRREKTIDLRCGQAADMLAVWRKISENMPVPDFVWWLMRETGIYAARGACPDGKARQFNLDMLYQRALDSQQTGCTRLSDFVCDLRESRETRQSDGDDHPAMGAGDDFVRVITMHKSKGLEFPVVILMDLQKSLIRKAGNGPLLTHVSSSGDALGLYLPAIPPRRNCKMHSQGREAFSLQAKRKDISEGTRLLYVAMTRARERLCLVGSVKDGEERLWYSDIRAYRIWNTRSMLDMIMSAAVREIPDLPEIGETRECRPWRITCTEGKAIEEPEIFEAEEDVDLNRILESGRPSGMYLPENLPQEPLKTSVTTLSAQETVHSEEDSEETVEDKRKPESSVRTFRLSSVPAAPAFLEETKADAVSGGTAAHRFLRLIRLDLFRREGVDAEQTVRQEAERMRAEGILSEEEAGMLRLRGIASFLKSDLGQRMLRSDTVRREVSFTMRIDPQKPTLVQGIIDCVFRENGKWILVDYKTDRDTDPTTFVPRHEVQMNWYRKALERLTGTEVGEMWLFALRAGEAYPVEAR